MSALSADERAAAARALADAERDAKPIAPLREQWTKLDVQDAYAIHQRNIADRVWRGA